MLFSPMFNETRTAFSRGVCTRGMESFNGGLLEESTGTQKAVQGFGTRL